jgi:phage gp46-like protein
MTVKTLKMRIDNATGYGDIVIGDNGIETDDGLRTAVEVLLFSDRTADAGDAIPDGSTNRRGWWADILEANGFQLGSRQWLLETAKATQSNRQRARKYATEAIQPLVKIGACLRAEARSVELAQHGDVIAIEIRLLKPAEPAPVWDEFWIDVDFAIGAP